MDVRTALKLGLAQLRAANISSHTLAAELLLLHATNRTRTSLYAYPESELSEAESQNYFLLIERRAAGFPLQHLTGKQEFWGLQFEVTPDVLIPRPETEHVIEVALDRLALRDLRTKGAQNMSGQGLVIADVGTGSGCIAMALAKELPAAKIYALDISSAALAVARRNAARLNEAIPDLVHRVVFLESNLFDHLRPPSSSESVPLFDLIVSNPPYVGQREAESLEGEVREHEPAVALFGGEEGYEFYADLISQSATHLKSGGILVLELGHNSLAAVRPLFDGPAWCNAGVTNDLAGIPRVLCAEKT
jgi:release factor glutamine methyltransferase